ncbi:hypothetical protein CRT38_02557 [Anaplasma phagocytophilum str. CRT38]|uniref:Uncharacterized protein n=3 Tax=Anaplasma phagocytophilum TaxID=948 RepID=S6G7V3_ANAPH|nr:hypothetical protein CRT38_02557 [Anaplasma phagocytophilum str. CRT38]
MTTHKHEHITIMVNEYGTFEDILEEIVIGLSDGHYIFPESLKLAERVPY